MIKFGGDPDHRLDTWIFGFVTTWRYGKWLTDINLLQILIRQMAALVRCALAEVCTVPLLLVQHAIKLIYTVTYVLLTDVFKAASDVGAS